jgi:hypothetical protein
LLTRLKKTKTKTTYFFRRVTRIDFLGAWNSCWELVNDIRCLALMAANGPCVLFRGEQNRTTMFLIVEYLTSRHSSIFDLWFMARKHSVQLHHEQEYLHEYAEETIFSGRHIN